MREAALLFHLYSLGLIVRTIESIAIYRTFHCLLSCLNLDEEFYDLRDKEEKSRCVEKNVLQASGSLVVWKTDQRWKYMFFTQLHDQIRKYSFRCDFFLPLRSAIVSSPSLKLSVEKLESFEIGFSAICISS